MPGALVLRFSDFLPDMDTIEEHRVFITNKDLGGYVWWGWWKKGRVDGTVEPELAKLKTPLIAGLFNRKAGRFYRSKISQIHVHPEGTRLPSPEPEQTPSYYREENCAAWFKMVEILDITRADFIRDFGLIFVGEETLRIRPTMPDPIQKLVEPFRTEGDTILHISDPHFGGEHGFPYVSAGAESSLFDRIRKDVEDLKKPIGLIVVSGDILSSCDGFYYRNIEDFLRGIAEVFRLDITRQIVVVPGNHDIHLQTEKPDVIRDATDSSHEWEFREFLHRLHGEKRDIPRIERLLLGEHLVEIMAMNSVKLRHMPLPEYGYVDWSLYENMLTPLDPTDPLTIRIAVLHHHLISAFPIEMPKEEESRISVTVDAGEVLEGLQRLRFRVVLHGHQHVPWVTRVARGTRTEQGELENLDWPIYIIAGGSSGSDRLYSPMPMNTYNLLNLADSGIQLSTRVYNSGMRPYGYISTLLPW